MMKLPKLLISAMFVTGMMGASGLAVADQVVVPASQQSPDLKDMPRPSNGMSMKRIEDEYGKPTSISGPVGEPPITTWEYDYYTVYFEHNLVIHTVLKHNLQ